MKKYKEINEVLVNIPNSMPIYFAGHLKPDQDSVCSCIALAEFLKALGKQVFVLLEKKDNDLIAWYNNYSLIVEDIKHKDYVFVALDVNEKNRLGVYEKGFDKANKTINIDHHQNNKYESNYTLSLPGKSSTCEMVFNIIKTSGKQYLTKDICSLLYSGMMNDTNCFTRRLSNKSFAIAQTLINAGINYTEIIKKTYSQRSMYEFKALAKLVNEIKFDYFHYVVVDKDDETFKDLTHNALVKRIAEDLRKIEGIDVFLMLIKQGNTIVAKTMTNLSERANLIAELFGGGGHKKEAGFTVENVSVEEIINKVKEYLKNN